MIRKKLQYLLFISILFIILLIFYIQFHPLYIYDTDDWTYIAYNRFPFPDLNQYNPTKVLPETLLPLTAQIGIALFMPITGDYIESMSWSFSIVLVSFIIFYIFSYGKIINIFISKSSAFIFPFLAIILSIHYIIYTGGNYFFNDGSVNLIFNYLIPTLLNAGILIRLIYKEFLNKNTDTLIDGFFILGIYLCIFSNMWQSIILISGISSILIINLFIQLKVAAKTPKEFALDYIKSNYSKIVIIGIWFISLIIESKGGRAQAIGQHPLFISSAISTFLSSLLKINYKVLYSLFLIILTGILTSLYFLKLNKKQNIGFMSSPEFMYFKLIVLCIISLFITLLYLILLSAKTTGGYLSNTNVMNVWIFYIIFIFSISLIYIISKFKRAEKFLIFILFILSILVFNGGKYKQNYIVSHYIPQTVKAIDENIINQVIEAETAGQTEVEVKVPYYNSPDGWPLANYGGTRISDTLYRHGITKTWIRIILVPDEEKNKFYGI